MDNKLKWAVALCVFMVSLGIYVDSRPPPPIDPRNPNSLRYENILRHADKGVASAQYALGKMYLIGSPYEHIDINPDRSKRWYKKAADNAFAPAAFEYARLVEKTDRVEAEKILQTSIGRRIYRVLVRVIST